MCSFFSFAKAHSTCLNTNKADGDVATKVYLLCHYIFPFISWPLVSSLTHKHTHNDISKFIKWPKYLFGTKIAMQTTNGMANRPEHQNQICVQKMKMKIKHIDISITFSVFMQTTAEKQSPEYERAGRWKIIRNENQLGY